MFIKIKISWNLFGQPFATQLAGLRLFYLNGYIIYLINSVPFKKESEEERIKDLPMHRRNRNYM